MKRTLPKNPPAREMMSANITQRGVGREIHQELGVPGSG